MGLGGGWEGRTIFMQMPGCETVLKDDGYVTAIVRTVSRTGICMKIIRPSPLSSQNGVTSNLRLGTVCGFLVFDYAGAEVAKYEHSM